ncbi:MAG: GFA family protein [Sphingobium sp.]|nr:GFA family protein [Sphingobium sp.]
MCGACRYETQAEPINIRACHCRMCQKAIGATFNARVLVPLDSLTVEGPVGWYSSSDLLRRGFCTVCGTTLFSERQSANAIGLTMGSLDDPDRFMPVEHIWISSKQAWLGLTDELPGHAEGPPS